MAETIVTNSTKSLDYAAEGKAKRVNAMAHKVLTPGIAEGGTLTYASASSVTVSTFVAYLKDGTEDISVREESLEAYAVTVTANTSYIVLREEWTDTESSFVKIVSCAVGDILPTDVIVGRTIWQGGTLASVFDYTLRQVAVVPRLDLLETAFQILPTESSTIAYSKAVEVKPGKAIINGKEVNFTGDFSTTITDTTLGRIDFVCIDENANILVVEGTDSATPVEPVMPLNAIIVGKITRGASKTWIDGSHITQYRFDEYKREFAGKIDTLQVQNKIMTGGDTGADIAVGGVVLDGGNTVGKLIQVKGLDGGEKFSVSGTGAIKVTNDDNSIRNALEGENANDEGAVMFRQTSGAVVSDIVTKGESAATDAGKLIINNNSEGIINEIPAGKDWSIEEAGVEKVKYIGATDTLDVTGTLEADTVKFGTTGSVYQSAATAVYTNQLFTGGSAPYAMFSYTPAKDGTLYS